MRIYDARVARMLNMYAELRELADPPDCTDLASLRRFSRRCPNPMKTAFEQDSLVGLWTPTGGAHEITFSFMSRLHDAAAFVVGVDVGYDPEPKPEPPPEPPFEVNLMEPLVGWRRWIVDGNTNQLKAINMGILWPPEMPLIAQCFSDKHNEKGEIVQEDCTCGIYAVDAEENLPKIPHPTIVTGEVYGWGRYVRGETGWRAQYAYPKAFHLSRFHSGNMIVVLKKYRVPIYLDVPTQMYDPTEEGYEYGHGENTTHGDSGTTNSSGSEEDPGSYFYPV